MAAQKKALIFDCDGVLANTEVEGHMVAFNQMWRENGVRWQWNLEQYVEKVKIGGGKERMLSLAQDSAFRAVYAVPADEVEWRAIVSEWQEQKSEIYRAMVRSGVMPPRPGVRRLALEALEAGWSVAICSTSAESSVKAVAEHALGPDIAGRLSGIFAGDVVRAKKPAPDIYRLALEYLEIQPRDCLAIEDSRNGLLAATAAGITCVITYNQFTRDEDFHEAGLVLSGLGEPGGEAIRIAANHTGVVPDGYLSIDDLESILAYAREK